VISTGVTNKICQLAQARLISKEMALVLVAGKTAKPAGVDPALWFKLDGSDRSYALGLLPLAAFVPNEADQRYDQTVEESRARAYAALSSEPPPIIACFGRRDVALRVIDGGHRITAARLRGDVCIPAIVRLNAAQLDALMAAGGQELINQFGWQIDPHASAA